MVACSACPVCVAWPRRRLTPLTCRPGGRRTGGGRAARAAVGGDRAVGRSRRTALNRQFRGTTLTEHNAATRTNGSGLREERSRARTGTQERVARSMTHGGKRRSRLQRHIQESLNAMRDGVFHGGQRSKLSVCHARVGARETAASGRKRAPQNQHGPRKKGRRHRRDQEIMGGRGPDSGSGSRAVGRAARGQHARICRALRFQNFQGDAGV